MNCPSGSDKVGKEGLSGITCPVTCQSRVAPRPKSGLQAQCGGGLENPWVGTERCVPLNATADRLHLALEHRRVHRFHPTLSARYRTRIEERLRSAASDRSQAGPGPPYAKPDHNSLYPHIPFARPLGLDVAQAIPTPENRDEFRNPNQAFGDDVPRVRHLERVGLDALRVSGGSGQGHEFSIGLIMACGGLGSILGPFIMGQLADRYFATEKVLGVQPPGRGRAPDRRVLLHHLLADFPADAGVLHPLLPHGRPDQLVDLPSPGRRTRQPVRADPPLGNDRLAPGHVPGGRYLDSAARRPRSSSPFFDLVGEPSKSWRSCASLV